MPFTLFLAVLVLFSITYRFLDKPPRIDVVDPSVAEAGSVVTLKGEFFGDERNGGMVTVAGSRITSDSYKYWSDGEIKFVVPTNTRSGMVVVNNEKGKSNGALFSNRALIPIVLSGPHEPGMPYVESIEPSQGAVGTLVTIKGLNFGTDRGESLVMFALQELTERSRFSDTQPQRLSASLIDYDYESWTDQEVRVYVPDGASSGGITISSDRGNSNAEFFEVKAGPGTKDFTTRRGYQLSYDIDIFSPRGPEDASLDLWIPRLFAGLEQRNVEWTADPIPLWKDYFGIMRYHFDKLPTLGEQRISQQYWFERYTLESQVNSDQVKTKYNTSRELYKVYTQDDDVIVIDEEISDLATRLTRRQSNPYLKARAIYDHLISKLEFSSSVIESSPSAALEKGIADAYNYSVLFCSLVRAAGVPVRPVAGYLAYNNKITKRHYWSEFYLEEFGWIPVDVVLGDGVQFGNFPQLGEDSPEDYYFGNLDNQHITFTRGVIPLKGLLPQGKTKTLNRMYGLQSFHEEASLLEYYDTLWEDIRIIEWW